MEASDFNEHISRRFNKDIEDLRNAVLSMGGLVEAQLSRAIAAVVFRDLQTHLAVAADDRRDGPGQLRFHQATHRQHRVTEIFDVLVEST